MCLGLICSDNCKASRYKHIRQNFFDDAIMPLIRAHSRIENIIDRNLPPRSTWQSILTNHDVLDFINAVFGKVSCI